MNTVTKKQAFLQHMREAIKKSADDNAIAIIGLHIRNVLPMSERQFAVYEKKMSDILKKHGQSSVGVNKLRELARRGM